MSTPSDQTDLQTDSYSMASSASIPTKSGLNTKKMLGISAATLLLGGSAWAISHKIAERKATPADPASDPTSGQTTVPLPEDVDVAGKTTDDMSFAQAFETARAEVGVGGVFSWHGHWYNTFEKEEWGSLSLVQRQEFTEMITGEHLPVKPYEQPIAHATGIPSQPEASPDPTIIEGYLNGQRVMGLDFDQDGIIDTLVLEGTDGYTYRVVDARGDDGLDTLLRYDSLTGELVEMERMDESIMLSNNQFNQGLEASMSKEIVDSILEAEASTGLPAAPVEDTAPELAHDHTGNSADLYEADDTYVNDGDVQDMDE
ncbi:hypothetical protein EXU85_09775 [Spirosoma sp. KCTC 42546]|uniref:hypothetical protein n=1 Tax=Spirosoma sp. KCTC 42546 TaxID=2520506 RepID=UPI00115B1536|nr:hypothetical protein [Spirosoma sp. KCTC 42546]QDK78878.1 hypothetical protein EXU85_09775 [Spirosoma sp. KCTC 42546]